MPPIVGILGSTKVWLNELINGIALVTSQIFKVEFASGYFSAWMQAISAGGVPNLRLYYEMSYDTVDGHFATPNAFPDIVASLIVETPQIYTFFPPYLPYIRFKVKGSAIAPLNPADTLFTMHLCVQ
jgi:hypothetical protein